MKILDKYILKTFLKTFLSIFFILIFVFILQSVWAFVKELAGKDLDLIIIGKLLIYFLPTLIPLILPLTILLASIMVFGDFAENYEFAAMKSAGISLYRAMRGLSIFIFFLSIVTFFFANNVIPWGEYQSRNLRRNIAKLTPAMAIAEGQFNAIGDINIKVDKKSGEDGNHLEGVILHTKKNSKNTTVIKAESGDLIPGSKNGNVLQLVLYNGNYYNDIFNRDPIKRKRKPHAKSAFEKYTMNIDLSALNDVNLEEKNKGISYKMLKINELIPVIDSLEQKKQVDLDIDIRNTINSLNIFKRISIKPKVVLNPKFKQEKRPKSLKEEAFSEPLPTMKDDISFELEDIQNNIKIKKKENSNPVFLGDYLKLFTPMELEGVYNFAISTSKTNYKKIEIAEKINEAKTINLNQHKMALHRKFALAFSCFLLFFVGAPLGAIIRKGGMGLPMVIAMGVFLSYYFIGMFSKNSAETGTISSFLGAWLPTLILLPLGIMLTRNATSDRGIFNTNAITVFFEEIWNKITRKKKTKGSDFKETVQPVKATIKEEITTSLKINKNQFLREINSHAKTSIIAFVTYLLVIAFFPLLQQEDSKILPVVLITLLSLYLIFYVITFKKYTKLKKATEPNYSRFDVYIDFFFGITSYPLAYFYYRTTIKKLKKKLENNYHDNK